ncbi:hypothetical protein AMTRI_Chr07g25350 [Amborella trichopoda]
MAQAAVEESIAVRISQLDLLGQGMEGAVVNEVMDVPDTPDRLAMEKKNHILNCIGDDKNMNATVASHSNLGNARVKRLTFRGHRDIDGLGINSGGGHKSDNGHKIPGSSLPMSIRTSDSFSFKTGISEANQELTGLDTQRFLEEKHMGTVYDRERKSFAMGQNDSIGTFHSSSVPTIGPQKPDEKKLPLLRPCSSRNNGDSSFHQIHTSNLSTPKFIDGTIPVESSVIGGEKGQGRNKGKLIDLLHNFQQDSASIKNHSDTFDHLAPNWGTQDDRSEVAGTALKGTTSRIFEDSVREETGVDPTFSFKSTRHRRCKMPVLNGCKPSHSSTTFMRASSDSSKGESVGRTHRIDSRGQPFQPANAHSYSNAEPNDRNNGKGINLNCDSHFQSDQTESNFIQSKAPPRPRTGRRMLVRNGCISPQNIAHSFKQANGYSREASKDQHGGIAANASAEFSGTNCSGEIHVLSPDFSAGTDRKKDKGILMESEHGSSPKPFSCRSVPQKELSETPNISDNNVNIVEEIGSWRSTRSRSKQTSSVLACDLGRPSKEKETIVEAGELSNGVNINLELVAHDYRPRVALSQATSSDILSANLPNESQSHGAQKLLKRQKTTPLSIQDQPGECSISNFLSEDSNHASSRRNNGPCNQRICEPVIEISDSPSPQMRCSSSVVSVIGTDVVHLDEQVRQVEADALLAQQLQEQFYEEFSESGGAESFDESIAWALQQEENAELTSFIPGRTPGLPVFRNPSDEHGDNYLPSPSVRNSSMRSINRSGPSSRALEDYRGSTSSRMARMRRNFHSRASPLSGRRIQFPRNMDIDMRVHLLEALEGLFDNEMPLPNNLLGLERDFNEHDYEMLLALDENNDHQGGATTSQINRLPVTLIQPTVTTVEACAICLEIPSAGDSVRHLPCLHRFHRDCIDSWLTRRPLCPICKSSVT